MAVVWAATLLARHAPAEVSDAFIVSRLAEPHGLLYGTLPTGLPLATLAARARPPAV
jgi:putative acyl-CoA dehydrogenase